MNLAHIRVPEPRLRPRLVEQPRGAVLRKISLTATTRRSRRSRALYTSPIPPRPTSWKSSNRARSEGGIPPARAPRASERSFSDSPVAPAAVAPMVDTSAPMVDTSAPMVDTSAPAAAARTLVPERGR
ncbi:MAG: hypothetical protein R3B70_37250 [Polyangiaceae bacterium]